MAELADFLDLTIDQARQQFRELRRRSPVSSGRQVIFLPVETLLCLAASFLVNHRRFGGSTAHPGVRTGPHPGQAVLTVSVAVDLPTRPQVRLGLAHRTYLSDRSTPEPLFRMDARRSRSTSASGRRT